MFLRTLLIALCLFVLCPVAASAQGGWDVWTINLRDGKSFEASPVWSLDTRELKFGHHSDGTGSGTPVKRSDIRYMTNNLNNSEYRRTHAMDFKMPTLPKGNVTRDLVIFDDGRRVSGMVRIMVENDKSGRPDIYNPMLVQNGVRTKLTKVAHIKFATR
jgi:hypothetical protein